MICDSLESFEIPTPKPPMPMTPPAPRRNADVIGATPIPLSHTFDDFKNPEILLRPVKKYVQLL